MNKIIESKSGYQRFEKGGVPQDCMHGRVPMMRQSAVGGGTKIEGFAANPCTNACPLWKLISPQERNPKTSDHKLELCGGVFHDIQEIEKEEPSDGPDLIKSSGI